MHPNFHYASILHWHSVLAFFLSYSGQYLVLIFSVGDFSGLATLDRYLH